MKPRQLTAIGAALLFAGCEQGPRLMTTEPRLPEVAGRYTLSHTKFGGKVDAEILSKAKDASIELKVNGDVILHKVPVVPESSNGVFAMEEFRSASGTFQIAPLGSTGESNFYGLYLRGVNLPDPMGHPRFRQKGTSLSLSFEYFNGDFTPRMVFTRASASGR